MKAKSKYQLVFSTVLALIGTISTLFGLGMYLRLYDNTPELITNAFPEDFDWLKYVAAGLLVITIGATYSLLMYPIFEALEFTNMMKFLRAKHKPVFWVVGYIIRLIIIGITGIPSLTSIRTHFPSFVAIVGSTFGTYLNFILPPLIHLRITWHRGSNLLRKILDIAIIVILFPSSVVITVYAVKDLINVLDEDSD